MKKDFNLLNKTIHFVGVGGSGMIALAQYMRSKGRCKVTGSDLRHTTALLELKNQSVKVYQGHHEDHVKDAHVVVVSTAIPLDNCEVVYAKKKKKKIFSRGEFLAFLMKDYDRQVALVGTHGKTTSTGMLVHVMDWAGIIPSFMVGGELPPYFVNGRFSESSTFVTESDESDGSFLHLNPNFAIVTNIEPEHLNYYQSEEKLYEAFHTFLSSFKKKDKLLIINKDNARCMKMVKDIKPPKCFTLSLHDADADFLASNINYSSTGMTYDVIHGGENLGTVSMSLFGEHNVYNSLGVVILALQLGIGFETIKKGLSGFQGVKRRMQLISELSGISIYDDYGHHPTEVKTTLEGVKTALDRPVTCVFQPHRFSRIKDLLADFYSAFKTVDQLVLTTIYAANEDEEEGLIERLLDGIKEHSLPNVVFLQSLEDILDHLKSTLNQGDVLVTMGAGDVHEVSTELARHYAV
ncbi:UDP-N-acetylmuramate--L-alanine ligase [Candidatus Marinamargulisbacteria bacterium SCGC AG-343-D04]|nr:UDP-N-acetylmuramate--L-alanine ligase [Candidatus Marinamargulisbacteria bacterium SCGC AG-343-D04]